MMSMMYNNCSVWSCSPTSDGSAAAILCSEEFVRKNRLESKAVEIVAVEMRTDFPSTFNEKSGMKLVRKYKGQRCL